MNDWKIRQEIYHRLNTDFDDDLNTKEVEFSDEIVHNAVRYFTERDIGWIYPAKSYMVGICYARWLSEYFGGNPIDYLDEQDLLHGNDPYFKKYSMDKEVYDEINEDIMSQLGFFNMGDYIGDPSERFLGNSYPDLDNLRNAYFEKYIKNYIFK